jgi:hypothetical protein
LSYVSVTGLYQVVLNIFNAISRKGYVPLHGRTLVGLVLLIRALWGIILIRKNFFNPHHQRIRSLTLQRQHARLGAFADFPYKHMLGCFRVSFNVNSNA